MSETGELCALCYFLEKDELGVADSSGNVDFSRSYCYSVWSAIGIILSSVCLSVCNAVHCGSQGLCIQS